MQLAIFQGACGGDSLTQRLEKLDRAISDCPDRPELVLCPELFASGYHVGDSLRQEATPHNGTVFKQFADLARQRRTAIVYGYPELGADCLHNSVAFVSADGELLTGGPEVEYVLRHLAHLILSLPEAQLV